jgi:glucose-6-phosphate 1-dehydrogenase
MGDQTRRDMAPTTTETNPENDLGFAEKAAGACAFVLFGASGDLTKRKLVPALFNLGKAKLLPENFALIGVSVDDLSLEDFRTQVTSFLPSGAESAEALQWFRKRLFYERGDFADPLTFVRLRERLAALDAEQNTGGNYLFYLATAPKFFSQIVQQLGAATLSRQQNGQWRRVVIEKPFGMIWSLPRRLTVRSRVFCRKIRFIASITTWAKRRCRTSWSSASTMLFSSPSGTGDISITCRSRMRRL